MGDIPKETIIVKCLNCHAVLETKVGETPEIKEVYTVCGRCMMRRNGYRGAKSYSELGIF